MRRGAPAASKRNAPAPELAERNLRVRNSRRASVTVTLECGAKTSHLTLAAQQTAMARVAASPCHVRCEGLGKPRCPTTVPRDTAALLVR